MILLLMKSEAGCLAAQRWQDRWIEQQPTLPERLPRIRKDFPPSSNGVEAPRLICDHQSEIGKGKPMSETTRDGRCSLIHQIQLEAAEIFDGSGVGRALEEGRQLLDRAEVRRAGLEFKLAHAHVFDYAFAQRRDGFRRIDQRSNQYEIQFRLCRRGSPQTAC